MMQTPKPMIRLPDGSDVAIQEWTVELSDGTRHPMNQLQIIFPDGDTTIPLTDAIASVCKYGEVDFAHLIGTCRDHSVDMDETRQRIADSLASDRHLYLSRTFDLRANRERDVAYAIGLGVIEIAIEPFCDQQREAIANRRRYEDAIPNSDWKSALWFATDRDNVMRAIDDFCSELATTIGAIRTAYRNR